MTTGFEHIEDPIERELAMALVDIRTWRKGTLIPTEPQIGARNPMEVFTEHALKAKIFDAIFGAGTDPNGKDPNAISIDAIYLMRAIWEGRYK